ncbi:hypothetical protein F5050DRAFT_1582390 [Lentinula boryana]|uniref:Uncharacterized protein n=1 Tax=Lentinula boryana TaxID=40481 RepID=A0ABQ8PWL1_9AGAR|nr:hypothetical protein F5050DRAFT_1582390 [Lentinula boryana]
MDVAIAVSKKCCFLCWSLHQKLNGKGDLKFSLPGTHNSIYAWIPPLEVPEDVLIELRNNLIAIAGNVVDSHSRQSSGASEDVEGFQPSEPELEQAMAQYFTTKK